VRYIHDYCAVKYDPDEFEPSAGAGAERWIGEVITCLLLFFITLKPRVE